MYAYRSASISALSQLYFILWGHEQNWIPIEKKHKVSSKFKSVLEFANPLKN